MTVFMTGATGFLGGYAATWLLEHTDLDLAVLVRARDDEEAVAKLWKSWQLTMAPEAFVASLPRVRRVRGDLHASGLGIAPRDLAWLDDRVRSVLHVAASLNRKSDKACLNTNLRGGLATIKTARRWADRGGLDRFTFVSTVAVAGMRQSEDLGEDEAIDWSRSDYDPYARTKKFGEHMVRELLEDVPTVVVRPSIAMGDPGRTATTQFDMVFATTMLADLRVLPLDPDGRVDIVNADWTGHAIARLHAKPELAWDTYHLAAGVHSPRVRDITDALDAHLGRRTRFAPRLEGGWSVVYRAMNRAPRGTTVRGIGSLWKVFWPYVTYDTVFRNDRVITELGDAPAFFPDYFPALYDWAKAHGFRYPHADLPAGLA